MTRSCRRSTPLGVLAADVATLSRTEIGELAEGTGGGSSAMPQKQNPTASVLVRSAAIRAPHLGATLHAAAAFAVDERPDGAWHAEWPTLRELLRLALGAAGNRRAARRRTARRRCRCRAQPRTDRRPDPLGAARRSSSPRASGGRASTRSLRRPSRARTCTPSSRPPCVRPAMTRVSAICSIRRPTPASPASSSTASSAPRSRTSRDGPHGCPHRPSGSGRRTDRRARSVARHVDDPVGTGDPGARGAAIASPRGTCQGTVRPRPRVKHSRSPTSPTP